VGRAAKGVSGNAPCPVRELIGADLLWSEGPRVSLRLADHWVWDSWLVEDGVDYHLFHARSTDLESWEVLPPLSGPAGFGYREVPQVCVICDPIPVNLDGEQVRIAR
ncbi:MAG: hypothetical protein ABWZ30_02130, partial [Jiangellaceae bacterium]